MRNAISPLMAGLAFILAASPAMAADPARVRTRPAIRGKIALRMCDIRSKRPATTVW